MAKHTHTHLICYEQSLPQGTLALVDSFVAHVGAPQTERFSLPEESEGRDAQELLVVKAFLLPALQRREAHAIATIVCHAVRADGVIIQLIQR